MSDLTMADASSAPTSAVVNLTQHAIEVFAGDRVIATFPPSGTFARLRERVDAEPPLTTGRAVVPVASVAYEPVVDGLPAPADGTVLVVSRVLAAAVERDDLYFPHDEVRDPDGRIIGCRALGRFRGSATVSSAPGDERHAE